MKPGAPNGALPESGQPSGPAVLQLGFRPFYVLASLFAALSIAAWGAQAAGLLGRPYLAGPLWHAHEMVFGYGLAVIVGFLFTAVRTWTNQPTPTGPLLALFASMWLAERLLVVTPFSWAAAVMGPLFPLACAAALAVPLAKARNRRNYIFVALLLVIAAADALFNLSQLGVLQVPANVGLLLALDSVLIVMAVVAGRVTPMFTNNGAPGAGAVSVSWLDRAAIGLLMLLAIADGAEVQGGALAPLAAIAAVVHGVRWFLWRPWKTLRVPLVWALHVAYAWIPLHLALRSAVALGWPETSAATHALTVGAIGGLTVAMMTRTALGHTGRPLLAGPADIQIYVLIVAAAIVRVVAPMMDLWGPTAVLVSALFWSTAFLVFLLKYGPMLMRARVDGKAG